MNNSVRKMSSALNYTYGDNISYERSIVISKIISSKRNRVPAAQDRVKGNLTESTCKAERRSLLKICESAEPIVSESYAPMVKTNE